MCFTKRIETSKRSNFRVIELCEWAMCAELVMCTFMAGPGTNPQLFITGEDGRALCHTFTEHWGSVPKSGSQVTLKHDTGRLLIYGVTWCAIVCVRRHIGLDTWQFQPRMFLRRMTLGSMLWVAFWGSVSCRSYGTLLAINVLMFAAWVCVGGVLQAKSLTC